MKFNLWTFLFLLHFLSIIFTSARMYWPIQCLTISITISGIPAAIKICLFTAVSTPLLLFNFLNFFFWFQLHFLNKMTMSKYLKGVALLVSSVRKKIYKLSNFAKKQSVLVWYMYYLSARDRWTCILAKHNLAKVHIKFFWFEAISLPYRA